MCFGKFRDLFLFHYVGPIIINLSWKLTILNYNWIPFRWSVRTNTNTNNALHVEWNVRPKTAYSKHFRTLHSSPLTDIRRRKTEFPCHAQSVKQFSCSLYTNCKKFWVMWQLRVAVKIDDLQGYSSEFRQIFMLESTWNICIQMSFWLATTNYTQYLNFNIFLKKYLTYKRLLHYKLYLL
jgi:hypothetical protein